MLSIDTKGAAFKVAKLTGKIAKHEDAIMEAFDSPSDRWSREELSKLTDIKVSSVCGAVAALMKKGRLRVVGTTISEANVTVQQLGLV